MNYKFFSFLKINPGYYFVFFSVLSIILLNCQSPKSRVTIKSEAAQIAEQAAMERGHEIYFDLNIGTNGLSCNSCHPGGRETRAEAYPRYKHVLGTMATLSMTHNFAVVNENRGTKWELGSADANALALYVTSLANGKKMILSEPLLYQNEWINRGKAAFSNPELGANGNSCATCHSSNKSNTTTIDLKGIAAVYPKYRAHQNRVITLEQQINHCLTQNLAAAELPLDHETIVALTCYFSYLSQGKRIAVVQ